MISTNCIKPRLWADIQLQNRFIGFSIVGPGLRGQGGPVDSILNGQTEEERESGEGGKRRGAHGAFFFPAKFEVERISGSLPVKSLDRGLSGSGIPLCC